MSINRDTLSTEIKAKRMASKAHYDRTAGPEKNIINISEFVYARPPTIKPGNPWVYGCVTEKRHSKILHYTNAPQYHSTKSDIYQACSASSSPNTTLHFTYTPA